MGIESDQVVYEYLSRVGDVAQQRQLPSSTRMRLVSELRNEIDRRRAKVTVDSPAAVRRIIAKLGSPDEVVTAAGGTAGSAPQAPVVAMPVQRDRETEEAERPRGLRKNVPRPRPDTPPEPAPAADRSHGPHLAGLDELGDSATQPDWWRVDSSPFGVGDSVPGFVGGVEIPELLKPPPPKEERKPEPAPAVEGTAPAPVVKARTAWWKRRTTAKAVEPVVEAAPARRRFSGPGSWSNPLLLLAAALLVAGAVLGNLLVLVVGWLIAWASRRLSDAETKWAVVFLPSLALTAGIVWLWGRNEGRWGEPIAQGHMNDAVAETWPWVVRGAAVASALFLVWRSQRRR
ncbi:hypothetical protein M2163_004734 [Streptomyces sp. SAI-135]|uniref:hypothetical protein n=1 Tax=unclassified Streptomyces TaxID=2593676 RepID=UPI002476BC25|nr:MULTISPECIES: hypothetical protein [unclassified Streptomyces]MDH6518284.1 hypothetical protein [Streptomyces sp. SAI-090]MDH6617626.1 hypothetical protein [Streptomyces sp. SAI-135]